VQQCRGELDVYVIGTDGNLYHRAFDGNSWSDKWDNFGGAGKASSPKEIFVFNDDNNGLDYVFILGSDDAIYYFREVPFDYGWHELSEPGFAKEIFVSKGSLNYLQQYMPEIFVIGNDGAVYHKKMTLIRPATPTGWSEWESLSDPDFAKKIFVTTGSQDETQREKETEMWVIGMDNAIYHSKWIPNSNYIKSTAEFYDLSWLPGKTYFLELIVEDNGWPCDYCTGVNQDAAKGALGKYDIKKIQLIVRGGGGGDDDDIPEDPLGPLDPLDPDDPRNMRIPSWTKFIAEQWSKGLIADAEFANAIKFLVNSNVIVIPNIPEAGQTEKDDIPEWIKFNAAQWSKGFISDSEFVSGIKWIIENRIITLK